MKHSFHEDQFVGLLLTFIGGAMDAYTYIHYDAFASAQTGNLVLAIIHGFSGDWASVGKKLLSTLFFFVGILLAKFAIDYFRKKNWHFWRLFVLYYEAVIFFVISLKVVNVYPALVTVLIAFTAAIQWIAFDKINGRAYTNLFTTGNLKGVATNLYDYLKTKEQKDWENFMHFLRVVLSFIAGGVVSIACYHWIGYKAVLLIAIIFILLALYETLMTLRFYRETSFSIGKNNKLP
ncbi:YoaK family protein [Enterococcus mediterraneensis]|uniref:YoaK family protein n=1 Tax=Enterococcus mediterraneensis TaxID=2364791 RepID=UPI000F06B14A|nr:YoaK family protein [Enterococcus mediterraneensis]